MPGTRFFAAITFLLVILALLNSKSWRADAQACPPGPKGEDCRRTENKSPAAKPPVVIVNLTNGVNIELVNLSGGEFTIGVGLYPDEMPKHRVIIFPFAIGKYEVTQAQWKAVMDGSNPSLSKGDNLPVENVSWDDIQYFLTKLDHRFRLPTEAEWEYAGSAGSNKQYSFGNDPMKLRDYAWFNYNSDGRVHPVGQKRPNQFGLYDMPGNVWEWCSDWYSSDYYRECYQQGTVEYPQGPKAGSNRVIRGGSWDSYAVSCRSTNRLSNAPYDRGGKVGFRLVKKGN